ADVLEAEVVDGSVDVTITNGFAFDPLEGGGTLAVILEDVASGVELGRVDLNGATDTLEPGVPVQRTIQVAEGSVTGSVRAVTEITSVGGQLAATDTSDEIVVVTEVTSFLVSSVVVDVNNRTVSIDERALDLEDIDEGIADRIVSGGIVLDV